MKEKIKTPKYTYNFFFKSLTKPRFDMFVIFLWGKKKDKDSHGSETNEEKAEELKKEDKSAEVGEIKAGINLQGYCTNKECLAANANLPVWVNKGFKDITLTSTDALYKCPDCQQSTVTSIIKVMFFNSEHSIYASDGSAHEKDYNYQRIYPIQAELSYRLKASRIRQHAKSLEDLITRSEHAMTSSEILNLVAELQRFGITVVTPPKIKDKTRLNEKIEYDYNGDFNRVFDVGRFTILCDNPTKLQTAVEVMKKAEKFNLIVSEDKDFFEKQSKTHYRFHNIKLYVPKHYVYVEMQATLKSFTTLEGYTDIENPKLSHLFYEHIRAWKPDNPLEEELKQASDETLTKINDVICEWTDMKDIKKLSHRYKPHVEIGILKPPQLSPQKIEKEVNQIIPLKIAQFVYEQLCKFIPEKDKGKAVYMILYEYYKQHIIGDKNPASCADFALLLQESRKQEVEEDITISQALETYVPLQANSYAHIDGSDNEKEKTYDCHQQVIDFLQTKKEEDEKKREQPQKKVIIIQGKSGSGKSLFCRYLEATLWSMHNADSKNPIPVYISFPKVYNRQTQKNIILQAFKGKNISRETIEAVREKVSFVFIMDGFDEIFDFYRKNEHEKYFYDRFNLNKWNANVIVTCRSNVLNDEDISTTLIATSIIHLWPFTKQQMTDYTEKFQQKKDEESEWTANQYEETLKHYPNLQKMIEEPFLLQLILSVLPSLVKQYGIGSRISKTQVYEVFNDQWIDIHAQNVITKLSKLRIQINVNKIKTALRQYCLDLGLDMFIQGKQVAIDLDFQHENKDEMLWSKLDPKIESDDNKDVKNEIVESKVTNESDNNTITKTKNKDIWERYFNGDSIAKYVLRRVGDNKYQFLHKSCQEYYAAQKIVFDIISWKHNSNGTDISNQQFQQQFEKHVQQLFINRKLLNEEMGIIQFIADRIHDKKSIFINLKSRLFRIIESSKNNPNVSIAAANAATILNVASVSMSHQNWDKVNISHAILDHAFLEGTSFKEAILDKVSLFRACLNYTNFTKASVNQINFGEYGHLNGFSTVCSVRFSPDGTKIVSGSVDKTIRLWDSLSGRQLQCLEGHSNFVNSAQFSFDGSKIVSCSDDKTIRVWDVSSEEQLQCLEGHLDYVYSAQFSPDGTKIVSGSRDKTIRLWDVSSGKEIQSLKDHTGPVFSVDFSSDGTRVVSGSRDTTIRLWETSSGKMLQSLEGHSHSVIAVQFSPDDTKIVSSSADNTIRLWDVSSGKQIQILQGHSRSVKSAQFSRDGTRIVSCSWDKTIRLWDVSSGKQLQCLEGHSDSVKSVQFSRDGARIVSSSSDKTIRFWDSSSGKQSQFSEVHLDAVYFAHFSHDNNMIVSGSLDKTVRLWDALSGKQLQCLEGHSDCVYSVQFSPDSTRVVSGSADATIRLWDLSSGKQLQCLKEHSKTITSVQFSPDGSKIVSCSYDKTIRVWEVSSGKQLQCLEGHSLPIISVHFSPDGSRVVSGSADNTILLWSVSSGKQIQTLEGHSDQVKFVQFSPDGTKIVSGSRDKTIRLWDVSSGNQIRCFKGHSDSVISLHFSHDGNTLVSSSSDKTIRLWDVSSGRQLQCLDSHSDTVKSVQFSPDGTKIVSCSCDNTIRVWNAFSSNQLQSLENNSKSVIPAILLSDETRIASRLDDNMLRWKCVWQGGSYLSLKGSVWKDANGLTLLQISVVESYGGTF
ncbi:G-protein beta WD-40 repeats containing protein [Reticulomyxa filosa]|uniref:G-protein beta WD-40 repeats containing protein n=1 Tax=Reticulomyxa filosa TaxID=46433 RepID=X6MIE6_RETFI|nr:G-protein beta WD-40 repeats containing protein [Reticulomyxa filosa]|eukprot:ETO13217.1 G-protein beta WD-40 repeats containing protein [Reticulomyxa filosa]